MLMLKLKGNLKRIFAEKLAYQPNPILNIFLWIHIIVFIICALICLYFGVIIPEIFKVMIISAMFFLVFSAMTFALKRTNIRWLWLAPISFWLSIIYTIFILLVF